MLKTFISTLKHQDSQPFEFETRIMAKLAKLQHHIITQILLILFKYIYTIKILKYS
jgi:hypothetical protein